MANRQKLRAQGIQAVIAEITDQVVNRKRRNAIERCFAVVKQWRGIVTRYDKLALPCLTAAESYCGRSQSGSKSQETRPGLEATASG